MAQDAGIERAFFREAPDGATVFFPWGFSHRGYRLPDAEAKRRARRAASGLIAAVLAVATWMAYALEAAFESQGPALGEALRALAAPSVALGVALVGYALWVARFAERLQPSDLEVSREEQLREAARLGDPRQVTVAGLVFAALSGLLVWLEPRAWWLAALGVAAGLGLVAWGRVLERYRDPGQARPDEGPPE